MRSVCKIFDWGFFLFFVFYWLFHFHLNSFSSIFSHFLSISFIHSSNFSAFFLNFLHWTSSNIPFHLISFHAFERELFLNPNDLAPNPKRAFYNPRLKRVYNIAFARCICLLACLLAWYVSVKIHISYATHAECTVYTYARGLIQNLKFQIWIGVDGGEEMRTVQKSSNICLHSSENFHDRFSWCVNVYMYL